MKRYATFIFTGLFFLMLSCSSEKEPSPDLCDGTFALSIQSSSDAECALDNGQVIIVANNATGSVTFQLNNSTQPNGEFTNLPAGNYTAIGTDENDCEAQISFTIANSDGVTATFQITDTTCGNEQGSISISASNGTEPYSYSINQGAAQPSNVFDNLGQGTYSVAVTDDTGCVFESEVKVETDIVLADVNSIIQTNCAVSGCHNGTQSPNFTTTSQIMASADRIMARTQQGTMPPAGSGRTLTQAEIDAIACWVNDGAQDN